MTPTQTTQAHTATPWNIVGTILVGGAWSDGTRAVVTLQIEAKGSEHHDNLPKAIVEAVNSHARLLSENKAMREALEMYLNDSASGLRNKAVSDAARAALSLSQVKP